MKLLFKLECFFFHRKFHHLYLFVRSNEGSFSRYHCEKCHREWVEE